MEKLKRQQADHLALSADEAARLLGISSRHLRTLHAKGCFPRAIRLGRSVRWYRNDIESWLADGAPQVGAKGGPDNK